jgi:hypothetical protein
MAKETLLEPIVGRKSLFFPHRETALYSPLQEWSILVDNTSRLLSSSQQHGAWAISQGTGIIRYIPRPVVSPFSEWIMYVTQGIA